MEVKEGEWAYRGWAWEDVLWVWLVQDNRPFSHLVFFPRKGRRRACRIAIHRANSKHWPQWIVLALLSRLSCLFTLPGCKCSSASREAVRRPLTLFKNQKSRFREAKQPAHCNTVTTGRRENVALLPLWSFSQSLLSFTEMLTGAYSGGLRVKGPVWEEALTQFPGARHRTLVNDADRLWTQVVAKSSECSRKTRDQDCNV